MNTRAQTLSLIAVAAFGAGVLVMDIAQEHREAHYAEVASRAIAVAEIYAAACGQPAPLVEIVEVRR